MGEGVQPTASSDDSSGVSIIDNDSKENSKETTVATGVETKPNDTTANSTSSTNDGTATTTNNSTKDNKETTTTTTDVDTKPNDTTANSTSVTMDNTDKEGSKSDSKENNEVQEASTKNN